MPYNDYPAQRIIVPGDANPVTGTEIIVDGNPDPELQAAGLAAAIIFQYSPDGTNRRAYVLAVEPAVGYGQLHLLATDFVAPIFDRQLIDVTHFETGAGSIALATQTAKLVCSWGAAGAAPAIAIGSGVTSTQHDLGASAEYLCAVVSANDSTTSAVYVNLGTPSVLTVKKDFDATDLEVDLHVTSQATAAATAVLFGVRINGVDYDVCKMTHAQVNVRTQASGVARVAVSLTAGTYTVQGRWKRTAGAGTVQRFITDDWISLKVKEVGAQ